MRILVFSSLLLIPALSHADDSVWQHKGDFGLSLSQGNSDTLRSQLGLDSSRKLGAWQWTNSFNALYGEDEGVKSHESLDNELKLSHRPEGSSWYWAGSNDFLYDPLAQIDYRSGTQLLRGYHFIDSEEIKLRAEAGLGVIVEDRDDRSRSYPSYRAAQYFDWHFAEGARLFQSLKLSGELGDFSNSIVTAELGLESALVGPWSLRLVAQSTYYGETRGDTEQSDQLITLGLGYSFRPGGKKAPSLKDWHKKQKSSNGRWVTSALIGGHYSSGNSDAKALAIGLLSKYRTDSSSTSISLNGSFAETNGSNSAESANFDAHSQYSYREPCFAGVRVDADYDQLAALDYRLSFTPYLGVKFWQAEDDFASIEAGPAVVFEDQDDDYDSYFAPYMKLKAEKSFTEKTRLTAEVGWVGEASDPSNYLLSSKLGLDHQLNQQFKLKLVCSNKYDNSPAAGRDSNDLKLIAGLEFDL